MISYLVTQAVNILILLGFALLLLRQTRADVNKKLNRLIVNYTDNERERLKLQLQSQIRTLQHELEVLERGQSTPAASALRPFGDASSTS